MEKKLVSQPYHALVWGWPEPWEEPILSARESCWTSKGNTLTESPVRPESEVVKRFEASNGGRVALLPENGREICANLGSVCGIVGAAGRNSHQLFGWISVVRC